MDAFFIDGGEPGAPLTIGGIDIVQPDLREDFLDGPVVHIIEGVLLAP